MKNHLRILGTRGIPANHGGFETFAEHLALHLVSNGWGVTVYCQEDEGESGDIYETSWRGVRLVHIPVRWPGVKGTVAFDWKSTLHAIEETGLVLTLGYNTALFTAMFRLKGINNVINMDGIEWKRKKWKLGAKTWLYFNEWAGAWLGNRLIADHPQIKEHLSSRVGKGKIATIPYGALKIDGASPELLIRYGLSPDGYAIMIARPEPENSVLEIVQAWSRKKTGMRLAVLGKYSPSNRFHRSVIDAASDEVVFLGAIYDKEDLAALRYFARVYIHGHQVGGTNPSLVEAMGAGNAVIAHNNKFNRWVAGEHAKYFDNVDVLEGVLEKTLHDGFEIEQMKRASRTRHLEEFTWQKVLTEYEMLFLSLMEPAGVRPFPAQKMQ